MAIAVDEASLLQCEPLNVNAESKDMATLWPLTETVAANETVPILKVWQMREGRTAALVHAFDV